MEKQIIKVRATKRGIRLWIEGSRLHGAGFVRGASYTRDVDCYNGKGVITLRLNQDGDKKVSGKTKAGSDHAIIDITASKCFEGFAIGQDVEVTYHDRAIYLEAK